MSTTLRAATAADHEPVFRVFVKAFGDLVLRLGVPAEHLPYIEADLERRRPFHEHLARTAEHFWVAEAGGQVVGYARTILRDGMRELTELFVQPEAQSGGVGRALLERAFPREGATSRAILASTDSRALARYLKAGLAVRFPMYALRAAPRVTEVESDLEFTPIDATPHAAAALDEVDRAVLGYRRPEDHAWLQTQRAGWIYRRGGQAVGYGFGGDEFGPFAVLDPADFPAVLAHAENYGHAQGQAEIAFELPLVNVAATNYLLERGFRLDPFCAYYMSDTPFGSFERYVFMRPPFYM